MGALAELWRWIVAYLWAIDSIALIAAAGWLAYHLGDAETTESRALDRLDAPEASSQMDQRQPDAGAPPPSRDLARHRAPREASARPEPQFDEAARRPADGEADDPFNG